MVKCKNRDVTLSGAQTPSFLINGSSCLTFNGPLFPGRVCTCGVVFSRSPGNYMGDVNISAILDSFSVSYDKRVRPNYGGEYRLVFVRGWCCFFLSGSCASLQG